MVGETCFSLIVVELERTLEEFDMVERGRLARGVVELVVIVVDGLSLARIAALLLPSTLFGPPMLF